MKIGLTNRKPIPHCGVYYSFYNGEITFEAGRLSYHLRRIVPQELIDKMIPDEYFDKFEKICILHCERHKVMKNKNKIRGMEEIGIATELFKFPKIKFVVVTIIDPEYEVYQKNSMGKYRVYWMTKEEFLSKSYKKIIRNTPQCFLQITKMKEINLTEPLKY